jgi:hypothetical protein
MITGELARPAERRTAKSGNEFVSALMKVNNDGVSEWWRVMVFEMTMCDELMSLGTGDILSAKGRYQGGHYVDKDGETKLSQTLFAGAIFPMRKPSKKVKVDKQPQVKADGPQPFSDQIGF